MVNAIINISEHANRILAIIKAKYGLKDKSQAIEKLTEEYEEKILEPNFRPEFIEEIKAVQKHGKFRKVKNVEEIFK